MAGPLVIEGKDKLLIELSGATGVSYGELMGKLPQREAQMISSLDRLESIINRIDKEMEWKTASTRQ